MKSKKNLQDGFTVDNPVLAFQKSQDLARHVMSLPKGQLTTGSKGKSKKRRKRD